ncbi:MAG: carboxypeptidase regulatory-like domain-containing protein, partial [Blastocatellia bacterium]
RCKMRVKARLSALAGIVAVASICSVSANAATGSGSIRGLVKDGSGTPLVGAAIVVVTGSDHGSHVKVVKTANTNKEGQFVASNIIPGRYRIKAQAEGFAPLVFAADVRPNKVTVFDSILLRRSEPLEEETALNLDPKFASRAARGVVFHLDEEKAEPRLAVQLAPEASETHGFVHAFAQGESGGPAAGVFPAVDFGLSQQLTRSSSITVTGQAGVGDYAPESIRALTTAGVGDRHRVAVAIGYGRFTILKNNDASRLGQVSLSATDTWQISGPVVILYGLQFDKYAEGASSSSLLPRLGIAVDAAARTRLYAGLVPGSSVDAQDSAQSEAGNIVFAQPKPVVFSSPENAIADRSYRLQFGGEQVLSENSSVEMMAFFDTVSGHAVGVLAIPSDGAEPGSAQFRAEEQSGNTRGFRAVYHRRMGKILEGAVGYSCGQGQYLSQAGITNPANLFSDGFFQIVSAKIDANFVSTGTRISTVMRFAPSRAVFAIDPFQGQLSTYDPNLSILVTQELPNLGVLPGQWTAILDLRNLFDQQGSVADDRQEVVASRFHRIRRVGVSVRF